MRDSQFKREMKMGNPGGFKCRCCGNNDKLRGNRKLRRRMSRMLRMEREEMCGETS